MHFQDVFFSWQSDLATDGNRRLLRASLGKAINAINAANPDVTLRYDEATERLAGSPDIVKALLDKIRSATIYVADISMITPANAGRPCPNPNVTFELGYAVSELGWDRILLLFNLEYGSLKEVPFDFAQNRIKPYKAGLPVSNGVSKDLEKYFIEALQRIVSADPKRPSQIRGLSPGEIRRQRDIENLNWMLSTIHVPTLETLMEELPHRIRDNSLWYWESFKGVVENGLFHLNDPVLASAALQLRRAWGCALAHDSEYHDTPGGDHVFSNPGDAPLSRAQQLKWDAIEQARNEMRKSWDTIKTEVRDSFVEIDLKDTNKAAFNAYRAFHTEIVNSMLPRVGD